MADSWLGKVRGHVSEAKGRFSADKRQREDAEKSPKSIILTKQEVQGEWDANRVLMTTIGGGSRRITSDDLATFRHNMKLAQTRFKGGKGITARQVIDMASSQPLSYVSANPNEASSDIDKARKEITSGIPVSAHNGMVRFITNAGNNAGKDSDVTRHQKKIRCITTGEVFPSRGAAAKAKGISESVIGKQLRGLPTRSGLEWEYLNG